MTINKKMIRNAVIGVVVLTLLGGAYWFALKWQPKGEENKNETSRAITLLSLDDDEVSEVYVKNENAEYTLVRVEDGENEAWSVAEYPQIEVSSSKVKSTVLGLLSLSADAEITDDMSRLSEFGLDGEGKFFIVRLKDGAEKTFILGDKLVVDSKYYIMEKGGEKIYTVSEYAADGILKVPNDFRETNLGQIDTENILEMTISRGGKELVDFYIIGSDEKKDKNTFSTSNVRMRYPYTEMVSSDRFNEFIENIPTTVEVTSFVSDDTADMHKFGLDTGCKLVIKDKAATHTLILGDEAENGGVYATYNDCRFIFTMETELPAAVGEIKPFDFIDKFAHIYSIDTVSEVKVANNKGTHNMTVKVTGDGNDKKYTCAVDGKNADEDAFKTMYQGIIGLTVTGMPDSDKNGAEICKITFVMTDGSKYTAVYNEYDERNAVVTRVDGKRYLILRKYVDEMCEQLEAFAKNLSGK